jgi:hypothetical protein
VPGNNAARPQRAAGGNRLRAALRAFIGIAVSIACLYFATRGTDWSRVWSVLADARPIWIVAVVFTSLVSIYIRAQRWRILLRPLGDVPLYPAMSATAIGFGASSVLPLRLGEFIRPALLGRATGVGMSAALSSVVLERIFDMLLILACFLGLSVVYPIDPALRTGAWLLGGFALGGLGLLLAMQRNRDFADRFVSRVLGWLPARAERGLAPLAGSFLNGLGGLSDGFTVAVVVAYSAYLWAVIGLTYLCAFLALGMDVPLVAASLATVVIVAVFVFLPQGPGFVGTWQAGCVVALNLFKVPLDLAVGYSILTWVLQMAVNIGAAGVCLAREDISLGQLMRMTHEEAPPAEAGS